MGYQAAWDTMPAGTEDCGPAVADRQYVAAGGQDMHGLAHSIYAEMFTPELKATFDKIETLDMTVGTVVPVPRGCLRYGCSCVR